MVSAVAVFCGSRLGSRREFAVAAKGLGTGLARAGYTLIYGGGKNGLMGVTADAALQEGGDVIGVIPQFLHGSEVMHEGVSNLIVTQSMHERKEIMFNRADAFVILPGGLGTFDEWFEILTWRQLGLHDKPIFVLNQLGWADHLLASIAGAIGEGFADDKTAELLEVVDGVEQILSRLKRLESMAMSSP